MSHLDIPLTLGLLSVALLTLIAVQLFSFARAPGWAPAKAFAWVVCTAAAYGVVFSAATARLIPTAAVGPRIASYLIAGAANAVMWLWFARAPETRRWRDLPRSMSLHVLLTIGVVLGITLTGHTLDPLRTVHATVETLGADYERPLMSKWAMLSALGVLSVYAAAGMALVRRRAESGMPLVIAGYVVFLTSVLLELGIGVLGWPLLVPAPVGFLVAVVPVGLQFQQAFLRDASRLAWLSSSLQGELASRTEERDAAREALMRQERVAALGRVASSLAHELGNPLQHVSLGLAELERLPALMSGSERRILMDVETGVDRMRDIVHRMHDLVDHAEWHQEEVPLASVVRRAVAQLQSQFAAHPPTSNRVCVEVERAWVVSGNADALVRALSALLANAQAAMALASGEPTGTITVRLAASSAGLPVLEVHDTGPGFPEEVLALAGEPFISAGHSAGLGLFLVHRVMHAHGGRVVLGNRPEGGALATLVFPVAIALGDEYTAPAAGSTESGERVSPLSASSRGASILLVDDEPLVRNAFARVLERAGHHVLRASDGQEALRLLRSEVVDLVVTDLMMPVMNGVEFAGVLAERHRSLHEHLIVVCGGAVTQDAVRFLNTPGLRVLNKPVAPSALVGAVSAALTARRMQSRVSPSSLRP